jgi:phosphoserine phosphatase
VFRGIVCDIGHVITQSSILNHLLREIGRADLATRLYDPLIWQSGSNGNFEASVRAGMTRKIQALAGLSHSEIEALLRNVPLTHGLKEFVDFVRGEGIRLAFVGAVPSAISLLLLKRALGDTSLLEVRGSDIEWRDGRVHSAGWICTPEEKRDFLVHWMSRTSLPASRTAYVGDSVGDIGAMSVLEKANRVGMNATEPSVLGFVGHAFEKSFAPLTRLLRQKLPRAGAAA